MRSILILLCVAIPLIAENLKAYQYSGVKVAYEDANITIEREISPECLGVAIANRLIWEGSYADENIPKGCKATFVTSVGQIQPMRIDPRVETYGELEVMHYLKQMQHDDSMLLVDSRSEDWYDYRTIPGAVNAPHPYISKAKLFQKEFHTILKLFGVKKKNGLYDFNDAKTIVLFCNGSWCSQSPNMIKNLLVLGYPAEKIKWYRGGMNDWLAMSMTSTLKI